MRSCNTGAAAFFAMREYEKKQSENGQPPSHQFAKEMMAGIAGAEVLFCHDLAAAFTHIALVLHMCSCTTVYAI